MFKRLLVASSILLLVTGVAGCSNEKDTKEKNEKIEVYTTLFPLQDFTEKIGGKYVEVKSALPVGADAHTFEPTTKDLVKIAGSDMFIYNGIGMEGYVDKMIKTLKNESVDIVDASKGITTVNGEKYIIKDEHSHDEEADNHDHQSDADEHDHETEADDHDHANGEDPHIWFDPLRAKEQAKNIANALIKALPEQKAYFEENLKNINKEFDQLDAQYKETLQNAKHKEILVSHAAYGYWGERYGIKQIAVTGLSPTNEPSQKQLAKLIDIVKDHKINYIFFESFGTPKLADTIQKEVGATVLTLNHVASITKEDEKANKDYFILMRENLAQLQKALYD